MKHYSTISLRSFERQLDAAVARFQAKCEPGVRDIPSSDGQHTRTRDIYRLMRAIGTPMDYRQVTAALQLDLTEDNLRHVHSRLRSMVISGWIEACGRVRDSYFTHTLSDAKQRSLFRVVTNPRAATQAKAVLDVRVDWLDQHFYQTRARLVTGAFRAATGPMDARTVDILQRRSAGETLEEIGQALTPSLTRERVRQIICQAQGQPVRHFQPRRFQPFVKKLAAN